MSLFGGGGGGGGSQPDTTTQYIREAPGIEERKLGLMDTAAELAKTPVNIPAIQTQGISGLEQQGVTASGITGVGANTMNAGIGSVLECTKCCSYGSYFIAVSKLFKSLSILHYR
jgi:hypothetical protein